MLGVKEQHIFWQPWKTPGFEHLHLQVGSDAVVADSVVVGVDAGEPFRVRYVLCCDEHYHVRDLMIQRLDSEEHIALHADGHGH